MTINRLRRHLHRRLNATPLPTDIDSITHIDHAAEVPAAAVGLPQEAIDRIWADTQRLYRTGMHPMLSICLRRGGQVLLNRSIGYQRGDADSADAVVGTLKTPLCLFSASKAISAVLVHLLEEAGPYPPPRPPESLHSRIRGQRQGLYHYLPVALPPGRGARSGRGRRPADAF